MVFRVSKIDGIRDFTVTREKHRKLYKTGERIFLVVNKNTIEVRCDEKLSELLKEKYESVMHSRYFGRAGLAQTPGFHGLPVGSRPENRHSYGRSGRGSRTAVARSGWTLAREKCVCIMESSKCIRKILARR